MRSVERRIIRQEGDRNTWSRTNSNDIAVVKVSLYVFTNMVVNIKLPFRLSTVFLVHFFSPLVTAGQRIEFCGE